MVPGGSAEVVIPDFLMSSVPFDYNKAKVTAPKMPRCDVSRDGELVFRTDEIFHREKRVVGMIVGIGNPRVCWETDTVAKGTPPICSSPDGKDGCGTCTVEAGEVSFVPLNLDDIEEWRKAKYVVDDRGYIVAGGEDVKIERDCRGCPMAEFGSALKGRGQRCKMTVRAALYIPTFAGDSKESIAPWLSDALDEEPGSPAPPVIVNVTATNFGEWDAFLTSLTKIGMGKVAPWGFWTTITASKKTASGYDVGKMTFEGRMLEASHTWFYSHVLKLQDHPSMADFNTAGSAEDYRMDEE